MKDIHQRLGEIKERITDKSFRENKGLGNEIGFHIFDYEPKYEMLVRDYVFNLQKQIKKENSDIKIKEFDLYEIMLEVLEQRGYLEKNFEMEQKRGSEFVFNIPIKILEEENVILTCDNKDYHVEKCNIEFSDIYSI